MVGTVYRRANPESKPFVEIGAQSFDQLKHRLLEALHPVRGIQWSESFIVTDYYYRGPRK